MMRYRALTGFATFLLGLALSSAVLYVVVPRDRPGLDAVLAKRSTCQVLIIGPSYINSGIREQTFDEEARRIGLNLTSCKYADNGLRGFELKHVLELLLSERWPKLEHVLIDITLSEMPKLRKENWYKPRVVDWHTFDGLLWIFRYYARQPGSLSAQWRTLAAHTEHVLLNYFGVGRGIAALKRVRLPAFDGEEDDAPQRPRRPNARGPNYEQKLRRATAEKARVRAAGRTMPNYWPLELSRFLRSLGQKQVIFLVSPVLDTIPPVYGASERPGRLVVFDFEDPARYPEVYEEAMRSHTSHLSGRGATVYSKLLAQRLLDYRKSR
jgi:hypothetical protein